MNTVRRPIGPTVRNWGQQHLRQTVVHSPVWGRNPAKRRRRRANSQAGDAWGILLLLCCVVGHYTEAIVGIVLFVALLVGVVVGCFMPPKVK